MFSVFERWEHSYKEVAMFASLDTETTGLDLWHGCCPYLVTTCNFKGEIAFWEWNIDVHTRKVHIPESDREEIRDFIFDLLYSSDDARLVMHNAKFDVRVLHLSGILHDDEIDFIWSRIEDPLIGSHCLNSAEPHGLKPLCSKYLGIRNDDERDLQSATNEARGLAQSFGWRVAKAGDPCFPATKRFSKTNPAWKYDTWLPRQVAEYCLESKAELRHSFLPEGRRNYWLKVASRYANQDAKRTIMLWPVIKSALLDENLWGIYESRRSLLPVTYDMECKGVPLKIEVLNSERIRYQKSIKTYEKSVYSGLGKKINLNSAPQLRQALFVDLGLKGASLTKGSQLSTGYDSLVEVASRNKDKKSKKLLGDLIAARRIAKCLQFLDSWDDWKVKKSIHANINVTGTKETRQSYSNPNLQQVGKGFDSDGISQSKVERDFNLRSVFGPLPNREWWSFDYSNVELRVWAYKVGNKELIECFDKGHSVHLLVMEQVFGFADKQSDKYDDVKRGDFAIIYGAAEDTVNATFGVPGAYAKIIKRFPEVERFARDKEQEARNNKSRYGFPFLHTEGGYRLVIPNEEYHKASNYYVQGTVGIMMGRAMVECHEFLKDTDTNMILQVHDELDFDSPMNKPNLVKRRKKLQSILESQGPRFDIPTPVSCKIIRHPFSWADGE